MRLHFLAGWRVCRYALETISVNPVKRFRAASFILSASLGIAVSGNAGTAKADQFIYGSGAGGIYEVNITTQTQKLALSATGSNNAVAIDRGRNQLFFIDDSNTLEVWKTGSLTTIQVATAAQLGITGGGGLGGFGKPLGAAFDNDTGSYWYFSAQNNTQDPTSTNASNVLNRIDFSYDVGNTPSFLKRTSYALSEVPNFPGTAGCVANPCNRFGDFVISPERLLFAQVTSQGTANNDRLYSIDLNDLPSDPLNPLTPIPSGYYSEIIPDLNVSNLQIAYSSDFLELYGQDFDDKQWYKYPVSGTAPINGTLTPFFNNPAFTQLNDLSDSATTVPVPFPIPIIGAAMGIAWSRKLRQRVLANCKSTSRH